MRCIVCYAEGKNFTYKICPADTRKGYTKGDVQFKKHVKKFHGEAAIEAAQNLVARLRSDREKRFVNIRHGLKKADMDEPAKNEALVVYYERRVGTPGGSDGKEANSKS